MILIVGLLLFALAALVVGTLGGMAMGLVYLISRFIHRRELRAQGIAWWK